MVYFIHRDVDGIKNLLNEIIHHVVTEFLQPTENALIPQSD